MGELMETYEDLVVAIGTVSFDIEALIGRAVAQGRRDQRRRRVAVGAGVVALGTLAVVPSAYLWVPAAQDAGGSADPADWASSQVGLPTPDQTDARLVERLPVPGDLVFATDEHGGVQVVRTLDPDGSGAGSVSVDLGADDPLGASESSGTEVKCAAVAAQSGGESCQALGDGWMFISTAHDYVAQSADNALDWSATLINKDGTRVAVHATNYLAEKSPTRSKPVLDLNEIEALAGDPVWFQPAS